VLFTDGITEAEDSTGSVFGVENALRVIREHRHEPAERIVQSLCRAVHDFVGAAAQQDDITVVVCKAARPRETPVPSTLRACASGAKVTLALGRGDVAGRRRPRLGPALKREAHANLSRPRHRAGSQRRQQEEVRRAPIAGRVVEIGAIGQVEDSRQTGRASSAPTRRR